MENIRAYNQMFSMTSFGARVEDSINNGRAPYVFKISGEVYHGIGLLCPNEGDPPRFLHLYIYDTQNEVANRMRHFGGTGSGNLEEAIVHGIINFLDEHNELGRLFRTARAKCADALAICRALGNPQFFITFTCNVNWPEIKRHMQNYPEVLHGDRADVVVRVFHQKVQHFCKFLKDRRLFRTVRGLLYTIEFQKHPIEDPEGYRIVSEMMIHGPCRPPETTAPYGYAHYRRRRTNVYTTHHGVDLDNCYTERT
nr:helitron helicase-like domain-containing protein [Tanacetum cinerariifolium]